MTALVTIHEVNEHLRRDFDDDDSDLRVKILAASSMVMAYLNLDEDTYVDSNGVVTAPEVVKLSVSILAAQFYDVRSADEDGFKDGRLPANVRALLGPLRDHVMA